MDNSRMRQKIVRTSDGIQYEVKTDEPYDVSDSDIGELVRTNQRLSQSVARVALSALDGLREVADSQAGYPTRGTINQAVIRFGISLSKSGAFFVTEGQSDAHVIIELQIAPKEL